MSRQSANWKDAKPRNILTLEERVNVIRAYEKKPVYQKIAYLFKCSTKQIKNIIANRESILLYYANRMADGSSNVAKRQRQEKIVLLGKVMYEFLRRVQCHRKDLTLGTQLVRSKALEVKETIDIPNFYPNNAWMQNFKSEYNIIDFETFAAAMRGTKSRGIPNSILTEDLIAYVSGRSQMHDADAPDDIGSPYEIVATQYGDESADATQSGTPCVIRSAAKYKQEISLGYLGNPIDYGNDCNNVNDVVNLESDDDGSPNGSQTPKIRKVESVHQATTTKWPSSRTVNQIADYADALQYLRPLEDFVLLEENYRAIGLISQLELVFRNASNQQT